MTASLPRGNSHWLECVGGPLDGELVKVPRTSPRYLFSPDRMQEVAVYAVREVEKRGPHGHLWWVRKCLVCEGEA